MPKKCIVICPFGEEGSTERERSDDVFNNLIRPITQDMGYDAFRSIDDAKPGDITKRVIKDIYEADLVIADLTESNPNVFYELALRHSVARPYILISEDTNDIPFDVSGLDVISIKDVFQSTGTSPLEAYNTLKEKLKQQIKTIETGSGNFKTEAWTERPGLGEDCTLTKAYEWKISYSRSLASDWLERQDKSLRPFIRDFIRDDDENGSSLSESDDENGSSSSGSERYRDNLNRYKEKVGEYFAYKLAEGLHIDGELYYTIENIETGAFNGWAILEMPHGAKLPIKVYGNDQRDKGVLMKFVQPPQSISIKTIVGDITVDIRGFMYEINFTKDPSTQNLVGKIVHPDIQKGYDEEELIVGNTEMLLRRNIIAII